MLNPVVLFFVIGVIAGLAKSDLRVPKPFYKAPSIITKGFYKFNKNTVEFNFGHVGKVKFLGNCIILLTGGVLIGMHIENSGNQQMNIFFFDLFKSFLSIFMFEMGIVASYRISELKTPGVKVILQGVTLPIIFCMLGVMAGNIINHFTFIKTISLVKPLIN
jgi:hypothetical protein